jgi:hypothetical protein
MRASVIPLPLGAHYQATVYALAEKALTVAELRFQCTDGTIRRRSCLRTSDSKSTPTSPLDVRILKNE